MVDDIKPLWVRGGSRPIVSHPDDIAKIMNYLRGLGDLRANAIKVERLWTFYSKKSGSDWLKVSDDTLNDFATYLETGIDEATYYMVMGEGTT